MKLAPLIAFVLVMVQLSACTSAPLRVGMRFENGWELDGGTLSAPEQALVKRIAIDTLSEAYNGFDVIITEGTSADRLVRVQDTPYATFSGALRIPGVVGSTYPFTNVSFVRADALYPSLLSAARCESIHCASMAREQLLAGFGRGVGATAAHELGHQMGFLFAVDSQCDDCYDGRSAATYEHFFGAKRWSPSAMKLMKRVLPERNGRPTQALSTTMSNR